jgi:hypothetical protein
MWPFSEMNFNRSSLIARKIYYENSLICIKIAFSSFTPSSSLHFQILCFLLACCILSPACLSFSIGTNASSLCVLSPCSIHNCILLQFWDLSWGNFPVPLCDLIFCFPLLILLVKNSMTHIPKGTPIISRRYYSNDTHPHPAASSLIILVVRGVSYRSSSMNE